MGRTSRAVAVGSLILGFCWSGSTGLGEAGPPAIPPSSEETTNNLSPSQEAALAALPISKYKQQLLAAQQAADAGEPGAAARLAQVRASFPVSFGPRPTAAMSTTVVAAAAGPFDMNIMQYSQLRSNWCGPASAYMLFRALGVTVSNYADHLPLSQSNLSLPQYTDAGTSGGTDWAQLDMTRAINNWGWNGTSVYVQNTPTSAIDLFNKVKTDASWGWALPADMVEVYNGPHYNSHPNRLASILHWTLITGYWEGSGYGNLILFNDPAANAPTVGWSGLATKFWYGQANAYAQMTQQGGILRGIAW